MRRCLAAVAVVLVLATTAAGAGQDPAEGALRALVERWATARNAHDAQAMRDVFAPDVDQISVPSGQVIATDLDGVVRWFETGFARDGRTTTANVESTRVRMLSPDTGIVDFRFALLGAAQQRVSTGHAIFVCRRGATGWKVVALRFGSVPLQ